MPPPPQPFSGYLCLCSPPQAGLVLVRFIYLISFHCRPLSLLMKIHTKLVDSISFRFVWFGLFFPFLFFLVPCLFLFRLFCFFFVVRSLVWLFQLLLPLVLAVIFSHLLQFNSWYLSLTVSHSAAPHTPAQPAQVSLSLSLSQD